MTSSLFRSLLLFCFSFTYCAHLCAQLVINEGSNKNTSTLLDEDGEYNDWIELYNAGNTSIDLFNYSLTDDPTQPAQWIFPHYTLEPGTFLLVFCSSKDRFATPAAVNFNTAYSFTPQAGWNNHLAQTLYSWDGFSNLVLNTCSYWSGGYTSNSIFWQTNTDYVASVSSFIDYGDYACASQYGQTSTLRPVLRINNTIIGDATDQNCNTCYPAPYGNWYYSARNQIIYRATDLIAAGLTPGPIDSLAFEVAGTDPSFYDYVSIQVTTTSDDQLSSTFINTNGSYFHTNFGIAGSGETIYLFAPDQTQIDELEVSSLAMNVSSGDFPDGSNTTVLFTTPTPGATNNFSEPAAGYCQAPQFTIQPGFYTGPLWVSIINGNGPLSEVHYTLDGSEPTVASELYSGVAININQTSVLKARVFEPNHIASIPGVASYFINTQHVTPVISISTNNENLYGAAGMFDNPFNDWLKSGYVEYFDSTDAHNLLMSQNTGMIMDGGAGGSRAQPQHSFRLKLADGIFGGGSFHNQVIPTLPYRTEYSDFYLRNGSNQYLALQYKDAAQCRMMCEGTHNYYSAWRPVTVYINGQYHGLYELREKFNPEKFEIQDNASRSGMDLLSQSYYYGGILRGVEGDPQHYWDDWNVVSQLDPAADNYVEDISQYYDLDYYTDYFIAESFMANVDWPYNNIKIYRSDATDYKWRFGVQDLELGLGPNSWTDCTTNHIEWLMGNTNGNPFTTPWYNMMQHNDYRLRWVNRFADLMNTSYRTERLLDIESYHYNMVIPEMANYMARWGDPNNVEGYVQWFTDNHNIFRDQLACRTEQVRNHIQNQFGYSGLSEVSLAVYPPEAGRIQINSIIPDSLPWTGIYFNGAPVTVTAIANPGYVFNYWTSDSLLQSQWHNDTLVINMYTNDTLTANFIGGPQPMKLKVSEINYHDDNTQASGDWIELHNDGNGLLNLTGWSLSNDVNQPRFYFPSGTYVAPHQYLVVAHNLPLFQSLHPDVDNVIGNFDFSLPASGGTLRLLDHRDSVLREINYGDSLPWPIVADGGGRTLEFTEDALDQNNADNWFAGCMFGSPGEAYSPCTSPIVFSEINCASAPSSDADDWVEVRNVSNSPYDISGWIFKDDQDTSAFVVPQSTLLAPGEMIVLCRSLNLFDAIHPGVTNRSGNFSFALNNSGEMIRLYDEQGKLNYSMYYQTTNPWPLQANLQGYTLELLDSSANVNSAANWFAGCVLGSPGIYYTPCNPDGISEPTTDMQLLVYPNPANERIIISLPETSQHNAELSIYDVQGKLMLKQSIIHQKNFQLNIADWTTGVYTLSLRSDNFVWHHSLVKQ
jgi:hypothetical protein